jgi:hypothetical protein
LPREKIQLATKFGIFKMESGNVIVKGTPEYVRSCCESSLKRLGVEYIDLYYQHRIDTSVPIEETVSVGKHPSSPFLIHILLVPSICGQASNLIHGSAVRFST